MSFSDLLDEATVQVRDLLGEDIVYTPSVGDPDTVRGVFNATYTAVSRDNAEVSTVGPTVFLRLADLSADPRTDADMTFTINSTTYGIRDVQPDGQGHVLILLYKT